MEEESKFRGVNPSMRIFISQVGRHRELLLSMEVGSMSPPLRLQQLRYSGCGGFFNGASEIQELD